MGGKLKIAGAAAIGLTVSLLASQHKEKPRHRDDAAEVSPNAAREPQNIVEELSAGARTEVHRTTGPKQTPPEAENETTEIDWKPIVEKALSGDTDAQWHIIRERNAAQLPFPIFEKMLNAYTLKKALEKFENPGNESPAATSGQYMGNYLDARRFLDDPDFIKMVGKTKSYLDDRFSEARGEISRGKKLLIEVDETPTTKTSDGGSPPVDADLETY